MQLAKPHPMFPRALGVAILVAWILYATTLFPIFEDYMALSLTSLAATALGVVAGVLAILRRRFWSIVASIAACLLLIRYFAYWAGIGNDIHATAPDGSFVSVATTVVHSGLKIIEYRLSQGQPVLAMLTAYNEFVMPVLQLGLLVALFIALLPHSNDTHRPDPA